MSHRITARGYIVFVHDTVMAGLSFLLALQLRQAGGFVHYPTELLVQWTATFTVIAGVIFFSMGLYRGVWRYASLNDLIAITRAVTITVLVFAVVLFLWTRLHAFPRSVPIINWFTLTAFLGGPRFLYRLIKDRRIELRYEDAEHPTVPVLLVGAGDGAELFIRSLKRPGEGTYRVVGIVAENPGRVGRHIHGVTVLGMVDDIPAVVKTLAAKDEQPQRLILTNPRLDGATVRSLVDVAAKQGMTLARLPRLTDLKHGAEDKMEPAPVAVEDLLGRPQVPLDRDAMRSLIAGRRVLVTGAGGSIGSELVRQTAEFRPQSLIMVESSEFALYTIDMEMAVRHPGLDRRPLIADVRDRARIGAIFDQVKPELVFHAAALKHVPLVEANPFEGVMTNVHGTRNVADACLASGTAAMVLISTDKAVNPTSVMGVSKRIAEKYCQALDLEHGENSGTRFVTVRFGNVLGSTGSVVPLFQRQLAAGGPLTVTHADMKRYFMTTHEAVELILEASAIGSAATFQEGKIFVLDMGDPVRIFDLAKQMIRLAGLEPEKDIAIEIIGLRPGEKLFEEVFHGSEAVMPTDFAGLLLASPRASSRAELEEAILRLGQACTAVDQGALMSGIRALVPEYQGEA